tara:strand:- start:1416 stop:2438 length:1023 start_codon:yes stop_codon:yes gene_type:complete
MNTTKNTTKITKGAIHSSIVFNNNKDWNDNYKTLVFGTPVELVIPEAYMLWNNEGDLLELVCKRKTKNNGEKGMIFELHLNGKIIKESVRFETIENFLYKKWTCKVYGINYNFEKNCYPVNGNMYESVTEALKETHALNQKMGYTEYTEEEVVDSAVDRIMEGSMDSDEAREVENLKKEIEELNKKNIENVKRIKKLKDDLHYQTEKLHEEKNKIKMSFEKLKMENEELKSDLSSYKTIHKIQCESLQKKVKEIKKLKDIEIINTLEMKGKFLEFNKLNHEDCFYRVGKTTKRLYSVKINNTWIPTQYVKLGDDAYCDDENYQGYGLKINPNEIVFVEIK